jgi:hypothetical protein
MTDRPETISTPPPRRKRRWLRRVIVAVLLVLVLSIGAGQFILWSDFPRNLVVRSLERQLGLRIEARSLSTGWFGRTTLRDVTAALPLADEIFFTVPRMDVSHTSLVRMIFGANLRLERLVLHRPDLLVRQYVSGRWNVQEAVDIITRATRRTGGSAATPAPARLTSASIPALRIIDGTLRIIDKAHRETHLGPLDVAGERDGAIVYRYTGTVPERLELEGQLVPGGHWLHEFDLALTQPDDWLRPLVGARLPDETALSANWRGQVRDGAVVGRVDFGAIRAGAVTASGFGLATGARGVITFEPQRLLVQTGTAVAPQLLVHAGEIAVDGPTITARDLRVIGARGNAEVNGTWDRTTRAGDLKAVWRDLVLREGVRQSGSFDAKVTNVFPDQPRIAATLVSAGSAGAGDGGGDWDARVEITGDGQSFNHLNWRARLESARYDWRRDVDLTGLTIAATQRDNVITIDDVTLPERGRLTGRGRIDLDSREWWLWLGGGEFAVPRLRRSRLAIDLSAWGSFDYVMLEQAYLNLGDIELSAHGFWDRAVPKPVDLNVWLTHLPAYGDERSPVVRGRLRADTKLVGTLRPLHLDLTGRLRGRDLHVRRYSLGDPEAALSGVVTSEFARFRTSKLRLLDANWELEGDWPVDPAKSFALTVAVDAVALERVGEVFGEGLLTGVADAKVTMLIPEPRLDAIDLDGTFAARDVAAAPFHAESVGGTVAMRGGVLRIEPVELRESAGTATASGTVDLIRAPRELSVKLDAENWPLDVPRAGSLVGSGGAEVRLDLANRAAFGSARFNGAFTRDGREVGTADAELLAEGRVLRVMRLEGRTLNGSYEGSASYLIDDPNRTKLGLELSNVDVSALAAWVPQLADLGGVYSGKLDVAPADDPRALGPLGATLSLRSPDGGWRALAVKEVNLSAFANLTPRFDAYHLVTRDATLVAADGTAKVFARLTRRPRDGSLSALVTAEFERLSLDQIVHAAAPDADAMPGRLTGRLALGGDPRRRARRAVFGDVSVELSESDLGNFDPIGFLYDLMNVGGGRGGAGPAGRGRISARLDNESLQVTNFYLFNRGVEIRGAGAIDEIFALPDSPIAGTLVGTARPLAALRLPFMADVDEILAVLQANATTVQVSGTLREPGVRATTLDEVSDTVRALLLGDVQRESGGP